MGKILVVEDEENIQKLIKDVLAIAKYDIKIVADGKQAIDTVCNESFDLILLDIMLPKLDGFEVMEKINNKKIPVIILTARTDVDSLLKVDRLY